MGGGATHERDVEDVSNETSSPIAIHAPQGRVPAQLSVPSAPSRTDSRPDFIRGFGIDIPEEEEEEEDTESKEPVEEEPIVEDVQVQDVVEDSSIVEEGVTVTEESAPVHGVHTRHTSRISVTLSVGSPTKLEAKGMDEIKGADEQFGQYKKDDEDVDDAVNEWTGSEDMRSEAEVSDDEVSGFLPETSRPHTNKRRYRVLASGQTLQTKRGPGKTGCIEDSCTECRPKKLFNHDVFQISQGLPRKANLRFARTKI